MMPPRIQVDPRVRFGKPCVAGTRITVDEVVELVRANLAADDIRRDYSPLLDDDDVRACLAYANLKREP